ncbi:MAG: DUF4126 family protein [Vulcanimicrobiaceae bacterium]
MTDHPLIRAFVLGAAAGLRSMTAPAATLGAAKSRWTGPARIAAAGELIVDKLPIAPSRLMPGPLVVRVVSGALCGRGAAKRRACGILAGSFVGGLGALAGSYGGYYARRALTRRGVPDLPIALLEDALALGFARAARA